VSACSPSNSSITDCAAQRSRMVMVCVMELPG
jgi:hypothetical protein